MGGSGIGGGKEGVLPEGLVDRYKQRGKKMVDAEVVPN